MFKIFTIRILGLALIIPLISQAGSRQDPLDVEVTLTLKEVPLRDALTKIEESTDVKFVFSSNKLSLNEKVNVTAVHRKLGEVLNDILTPLMIRFTVHPVDNFVVLTTANAEGHSVLPSDVPTASESDAGVLLAVSGKVTDNATGQPMAGVNVIVKGTTNGTSTNAEGTYRIDAGDNDILVFSFIGYRSIEVTVSSRQSIDVTMDEDVSSLNEVVVNAGYWEVKERERTGNISRVTAEEIAKQPVSNPLQALQGRMPGVFIQQYSGIPGASVTVQVRGRNSLRANGNSPFYIVDGVPFTANTITSSPTSDQILQGAGDSPLNAINPNDIESIEVLKDADATAIYGSRGANGVILITTKKSKSGTTKVDATFSSGLSRIVNFVDMQNTEEYLETVKSSFENDGTVPAAGDYEVNGVWDQTKYTNWQKELVGGIARTTNAQVSVSGGDELNQFLLSAGYLGESSVYPGDFSYGKGSIHLTTTHQSKGGRLRIQAAVTYTVGKSNLPMRDLMPIAIATIPNSVELYNEDGALQYDNTKWPALENPASGFLRKYDGKDENMISNVQISYKIIEGLNFRTSLGYTSLKKREMSTSPMSSFNQTVSSVLGSARYGNNGIDTWIAEPQLDFAKTIGEGKLSAIVGSTFQQNQQSSINLLASGFVSDALLENIRAAATVTVHSADQIVYRYNAIYARLSYVLKDRYLFNLTGRRDGSSRFGPGNRFGNFGALGGGWIFSEESFADALSHFLSFGKLRGSHGITGSDQIGDYQYLDTYVTTSTTYQGGAGLVPSRLANPDFGWESNRKTEVALELGFLRDRIFLEGSYYRNRTGNQLVGYAVPDITGQSTVQYNLPAVVQNTGWEIDLSTTNVSRNDFQWKTSVNLTIPKTNLVEYPNIAGSAFANTYVVGEPITTRLKHRIVIDPVTGYYAYEDTNEDGVVDVNDRILQRNGVEYYGGINNEISFRGFEMSFLIQGTKQRASNYLAFFLPPGFLPLPAGFQDGSNNNIPLAQKPSRSTSAFNAYNNASNNGDIFVSDASFFRLKNASIGYRFPGRWLRSTSFNGVRIFANGQNLATFTKYFGFDPELPGTRLPPMRTITFGVQATL